MRGIFGDIREAWDRFWDRLLENNGALLHVVGDLVIRTAAIYFGKVLQLELLPEIVRF